MKAEDDILYFVHDWLREYAIANNQGKMQQGQSNYSLIASNASNMK
jgi:hypothetical protein